MDHWEPSLAFTGFGGMAWYPDGSSHGKFMFSLLDGKIALYTIDLTASTQSASYVKTISLPTGNSDTELRWIYVNKHESDGTYELFSHFRSTDKWYYFIFDVDKGSVAKETYEKSGDMLTHRANPTNPTGLGVLKINGTYKSADGGDSDDELSFEASDVLRWFVGNRPKWIYELHMHLGL